jgi:RNase P/RNase MRP subunit POP5
MLTTHMHRQRKGLIAWRVQYLWPEAKRTALKQLIHRASGRVWGAGGLHAVWVWRLYLGCL